VRRIHIGREALGSRGPIAWPDGDQRSDRGSAAPAVASLARFAHGSGAAHDRFSEQRSSFRRSISIEASDSRAGVEWPRPPGLELPMTLCADLGEVDLARSW
jgi:hypothetical protein